MKKKMKSILSSIMIFLFAFNFLNVFSLNVKAANEDLLKRVNTSIEKTHNFIMKNGTWSSDWKTVAFNKSGIKLPENYNSKYLKDTEKLLKDSKGYFYKVTDYERITLGVVAAGGDPQNIGGYNLLDKIYNFNDPNNAKRKLDFQGLNGVIYGLIALDTKGYEIPKGAKYTREYMLDYILENRNSDGGWDLNMNGKNSDVDITSMTLIALAPYHDYVNKNGKKVKDAIDGAVEWLDEVQRKDGGFNSWFTENNSESCAQTIIGLCANGIDPTSAKFTKNRNLVENLLEFQQANGEFYHLMDGSEGVNGMSTEQAYQALIAYRDFVNKKGSIYWFDGKKVSPIYRDQDNSSAKAKDKDKDSKDVVIDEDVFVVTGEEKVQRVFGKDRFETSINIAEKIKGQNGEEKFNSVIISSAYGFADSLSGSILSKKLNAPILLVGKNLNDSAKVIKYVNENLNKDGKIYILGGQASVNSSIENKFKESGYKNIKRIGGKNRFDTCSALINELVIKESTPVVIVNGMNFPDALSIGAPASIKGYPILLSEKNSLPNYVKEAVKNIKPSEVYIIGGEASISKNIEKEINKINSSSKIIRLSGKDRYETSFKINEYFNYNEHVIMASGENYPDALSASALAGCLNGSLLLVNDSKINNQIKFINKDKTDSAIIIGGKNVVSDKVEKSIKELLIAK